MKKESLGFEGSENGRKILSALTVKIVTLLLLTNFLSVTQVEELTASELLTSI